MKPRKPGKQKPRKLLFMPRKRKPTTGTAKPEEHLWIVDANNRIIGKAPRSEVHAKNLMHRSVYVFIMNRKGEVFIQRRGLAKEVFPGYLDAGCAGQVIAGETYRQTAARELKEELGLGIKISQTYTLKASKETDWEHVGLFVGRHDGPVTIREPKSEIIGGKFYAPEKLLKDADAGVIKITPNLRTLLTWFIKNRNRLRSRNLV